MVTAVIPDIIFTATSISCFRNWYFQKRIIPFSLIKILTSYIKSETFSAVTVWNGTQTTNSLSSASS